MLEEGGKRTQQRAPKMEPTGSVEKTATKTNDLRHPSTVRFNLGSVVYHSSRVIKLAVNFSPVMDWLPPSTLPAVQLNAIVS